MLGEKHSLLNEFPEFNELIHSLAKHDAHFKKTMQRYDDMDKEIRSLELQDSPIVFNRNIPLLNQGYGSLSAIF